MSKDIKIIVNEISTELTTALKKIFELPTKYRPSKNLVNTLLKNDLPVLKKDTFDPAEIENIDALFLHVKSTKDKVSEIYNSFNDIFKEHQETCSMPIEKKSQIINFISNFMYYSKTISYENVRKVLLELEVSLDQIKSLITENKEKFKLFYESEKKLIELFAKKKMREKKNEESKHKENINNIEDAIEDKNKEKQRLQSGMIFRMSRARLYLKELAKEYEIAIDTSEIVNKKDAIAALRNLIKIISEIDDEFKNPILDAELELYSSSQHTGAAYEELWKLSDIACEHKYLSHEEFMEFSKTKLNPVVLKYLDYKNKPIAFLLGEHRADGSLYVHQFGVHPLYREHEVSLDLFVALIKKYSKDQHNFNGARIIIDIHHDDKTSREILTNLIGKIDIDVITELKDSFYGDSVDAYRFIFD